MSLHLISVHHAEHGLAAVEAVSPAVPGLATRLVDDAAVRGAATLGDLGVARERHAVARRQLHARHGRRRGPGARNHAQGFL